MFSSKASEVAKLAVTQASVIGSQLNETVIKPAAQKIQDPNLRQNLSATLNTMSTTVLSEEYEKFYICRLWILRTKALLFLQLQLWVVKVHRVRKTLSLKPLQLLKQPLNHQRKNKRPRQQKKDGKTQRKRSGDNFSVKNNLNSCFDQSCDVEKKQIK